MVSDRWIDELADDRDIPTGTTARQRPTRAIDKLSRDQCLALLASHHFGRVAIRLGEGPPVIRPVNYLFDLASQSVVFRTDPGSKLHALLHSTEATFEIDGVDEVSQVGWSVIIQGVTEKITREHELRRLGRLGLKSWAPGAKAHWIRIRARTVSGRRLVAGADGVPGVYLG